MAVDASRGRLALAVGLPLGVALLVRLAALAVSPRLLPAYDSLAYRAEALSLTSGHGFGPSPFAPAGGPTAYWPPGYPLFLAGVRIVAGGSEMAPRLAQVLLGVLAVALTGLVATRLWGARRGVVTLALGAIYVPLVMVGAALMSELLSVVFELAATAAVLELRRTGRTRWSVVCGVCLALAVLTRVGNVVILPLLLALARPPAPRGLGRGQLAILGATALLVVLPWTVRSSLAFHRFIPLTNQTGLTLAGLYNPRSAAASRFPAQWLPPASVPTLAPLFHDRTLDESGLDRAMRGLAVRYALAHPGYVARATFWNTIYLIGLRPDYSRFEVTDELGLGGAWSDAATLFLGFFVLLGVIGVVRGRARGVPSIFWMIPVVYLVTTVVLQGTPRFRSPLDPFVVLLAAAGVDALMGRPRPQGAAGVSP